MSPPAASLVVYTDGSCLGNPGPGGWAWAVPDGQHASGGEARTTNQRMEVTAVLEALRSLPAEPITVMSDSTYVVKCFQDRWWEGWIRRGWRNTAGKPVANRDLWEPLIAVALAPERQIAFKWVKGHSGDRWNDFVDELAVAAATSARQP
jgi:ribonuclease HI